jgi:hypothetical protein
MKTRVELKLWDDDGTIECSSDHPMALRLSRLIILRSLGLEIGEEELRSALDEPTTEMKATP